MTFETLYQRNEKTRPDQQKERDKDNDNDKDNGNDNDKDNDKDIWRTPSKCDPRDL